jgi:hypothetical protein
MKRIYCRACDACGLMEVINLGRQPPSNALLDRADAKEQHYPLRMMVCRSCYLLQLDHDVPHTELFGDKYPYFSGASPSWVAHCRQYAGMISKRLDLQPGAVIVEIGGNDGTLLKNFQGTHRLNIEPSKSVAEAAVQAGVPTIVQAWGHATKLDVTGDLIIANNVMAHTPDLQGFIQAIKHNLTRGGTFTAEFPWALKLIQGTQFDTIYHEHYSYLSLRALIPLFAEHGLSIYDVEELPTHGGSLRIYAAHVGTRETTASIGAVLYMEQELKLLETYWKFRERAFHTRSDLEVFLRAAGPVYAAGAAAKGNTLINWLGLNNFDIVAVSDPTPAKQRKFLPGSRIPIITEEQLLAQKPEYVLILAWNWAEEISSKLHAIRGWNGQFVTAIPGLRIF